MREYWPSQRNGIAFAAIVLGRRPSRLSDRCSAEQGDLAPCEPDGERDCLIADSPWQRIVLCFVPGDRPVTGRPRSGAPEPGVASVIFWKLSHCLARYGSNELPGLPARVCRWRGRLPKGGRPHRAGGLCRMRFSGRICGLPALAPARTMPWLWARRDPYWPPAAADACGLWQHCSSLVYNREAVARQRTRRAATVLPALTCAACGKEFVPKRIDVRHCSLICKQRTYRARRR